MYNIGTVTTTANSTKVTGTNTKWKDNNSRVSAEQIILIVNGTTAYINSIQSIQSDTELTLSFSAPVAVKNGPYNILTTMVNSVSDAANKIVAMNVANVQFSDIVNRLATETGVIEVVLPDGTKKSMKTFAEMDKQLDGKFDKTGGTITRNGAAISLKNIAQGNNHYLQYVNADGKRRGFVGYGSDTNKNFSIVNDETGSNFTLGEAAATINGVAVIRLGDYGLGDNKVQIDIEAEVFNGFFASQKFESATPTTAYFGFCSWNSGKTHGFQLGGRNKRIIARTIENNVTTEQELYHTRNTTKDSNGNLKAASPIIRVFADHVDPNEEAEGVTLKKLHTGIYQLHGVLGLHSDASWGGINGGITIPCGINQLPLVYALYDVLEKGKQHPFDGRIVEPDEDGDIVLYTTYRKHDLPQNIQYERFKLYPEFLKEVDGEKVELTPGEPCDIPVGHWVDVRVNMPSNSIYNQKQAEAERLAKIEAERLAQEEAKRAAEEVERAE
ncbi:hypothetical protein [Providencia huaxiensis]|uniref:phage tail fiber protein n=1 Tax=Providencia huaxiensis TaxID=2027290 RepID=UPI0032DA8E47